MTRGTFANVAPTAGLVAALVVCILWARRYSEYDMLTHGTAPFTGYWAPHLPLEALLPTLVIAVVVAAYPLHARLRWVTLSVAATMTSMAWTVALALVDGRAELIRPLATRSDYLHDVPRVRGLRTFLSTFTDHVDLHSVDNWTTHVAGHPPGALLTYVGLDRIGLGGPWPAAWLDIAGGAAAVPAALIACRVVAGEQVARRAAPFLALTPAALWVATSADGFFLGVSAWCVALAALAGARRSGRLAVAAGLLCGLLAMLSYGLVLIGLIVLAALFAGGGSARFGAYLGLSALTVVLAVAAAGFWWLDGLAATTHRVLQGVGGRRPYGYWFVADLVLLAVAVGPAVVTALSRRLPRGLWPLVAATAVAVLVADLSGQSKGEVERIWLPFTPWLVLAAAGLRNPRWWLMLQGMTAITFQLLVRSSW